MPVVIPSGSNEILFVTPESASLDFRFNAGNRTSSGVMGKWEIDPDDQQSLQFRIPKEKFGGSTDRIAFYVSSSGKVGIGTKDPEEAFDVRDMAEDVAETEKEREKFKDATARKRKKLFQASRTEANQVISGSLKGNAASATTLETARTIGGVSFNGSSNINLPGVNIAGNQNTTGNAATATSASYATTSSMTTGNAATATTLETARSIGGVSFDGSADISLPGVNRSGTQNTTGVAATATTALGITAGKVTLQFSVNKTTLTITDGTTTWTLQGK